jgi:hypothetical protein
MESFVSSCDTFVFCLHLFHNSSQITFALIWIVKQGRSIFITYLLYTIFEQTILFFLKGMFSLSLHFISCYTGTLICPSMAKYFSDYCSFIINLEWKLYKNQFCVLQVWKRHLRSFSFTLTQTYMPMYTCMCIDVHIIYILYILYMYFAYMYILYMCIYIYICIYMYIFVFAVLGFGLRALHLLGRCFTPCAMPPALFWSRNQCGLWSSYLCLLHSWDYRFIPLCLVRWLRWVSLPLFPGLALNYNPPNFCLLSS